MFPAENAQLDVPVEEFKWEIPVSSTNVGPTFYVTTDKMFVLLQMIYTTINSWSPSVQLTARVYGVDGTKKFSTISESASSFIMSQDSYSANCGPMAVTKLQDDNGNLVYQVTYDTPELKVDITHTSLSKSFQLGTGQHLFDDNDQDQGYVKSKFLPRAKAVGKIIVDGVESECSGFSCLTFVTQHIPQGIALWNFCDFQAKDHALMLYQFHLPQGSEKSKVSQGALLIDGQYVAITVENTTSFHETEYDQFSGYNIPTSLTNEWAGKTVDGRDISIKMNLKLNNLLDKIDILSELPYIIRVFVQTFITAPYVYQWLEDTTITIQIAQDEPIQVNGTVFHECSFMGDYEQE